MARTLSKQQIETIRRLHREGYSAKEIRRFTLHEERTILKYVDEPRHVHGSDFIVTCMTRTRD